MAMIKRSATVGYTQRQMFELVNDIEAYPRFLPWCRSSRVLFHENNEIQAELVIAWSGMQKSFTTRNRLLPYERIDITLVHGPFRYLAGAWDFIAMGEDGCKVNLELNFEFTGSMLDLVFQPIFHHIANSLVDLFCKRAAEVYGDR